MSFRSKLILIISLILIFLGFLYLVKPDQVSGEKIRINEVEFNVIRVDDQEERTQGLSGREALPSDYVMLFVFDSADAYGIWMKDMNFPIDILWLDEGGNIIHIENNISPDTYPKVFFPPGNSLYIIEANAGFALQNSLSVGKKLDIPEK